MKSFVPVLLVMTLLLSGCLPTSPSLPKASDVQSIKVVGTQGETPYVVPAEQVSVILDLFRSGSKDSNPAKWQIMGYDLEITTVAGTRINVWLFKTGEGKGAFAIGKTWEEKTYYRGSSDAEIAATIKKAKDKSKK